MDEQKTVDNFKEHLAQDTQEVRPAFDLKEEIIRWVKVEHGLTSDGDYVWHFQNHHKARPMPRDLKRTYEIIITYLDKVLPKEIEKVIQPPASDWDIKLITVKAKGIAKTWSFSEADMAKPLKTICDMISDMIEKDNPRRNQL